VLGGTGVVSSAVEGNLRALAVGTVKRIAGSDRYSTGSAISASFFAPGVPVVYVATGTSFPDALSGGAAAAFSNAPVLLVLPNSVPSATATEITRLKPARIVVLGGVGAVSDGVRVDLSLLMGG
jgi:putative cell wall-binding protein